MQGDIVQVAEEPVFYQLPESKDQPHDRDARQDQGGPKPASLLKTVVHGRDAEGAVRTDATRHPGLQFLLFGI